MLDEYVSELKQALQARRAAEADLVIGNGDPVGRGKVQGLDAAIATVDDLFTKYLEPAEEPPAVKQWAAKDARGPRQFGSRRVA